MNIVNRLRSARARLHDEGFSNLGSEIDLMEEAADLIERIQDEEAGACAEIAEENASEAKWGIGFACGKQIADTIRARIADRKAAQNP